MLRTLELAVKLQMANRDHLLVRQCPGFFLYRPTYGRHRFSGGVSMEIANFEQILRHVKGLSGEGERRIAFLHEADDARKLFSKSPSHVAIAGGQVMNVVKRVHQSTGKPGVVVPPGVKFVTEALQTLRAPSNAHIGRMIRHMYSLSPDSPIGTTQPVELAQVKLAIQDVVERSRAALLTTSMLNAPWVYSFHGSRGRLHEKRSSSAEQPSIYIDVVEDVDTDRQTQATAIARVKQFFAEAGPGVLAPAKRRPAKGGRRSSKRTRKG